MRGKKLAGFLKPGFSGASAQVIAHRKAPEYCVPTAWRAAQRKKAIRMWFGGVSQERSHQKQGKDQRIKPPRPRLVLVPSLVLVVVVAVAGCSAAEPAGAGPENVGQPVAEGTADANEAAFLDAQTQATATKAKTVGPAPNSAGQAALAPGSPDPGCQLLWPRRQFPVPESDAERPYLDQIVACAGGATLRITNNSKMVWAFYSPDKTTVTPVAPTDTMVLFHQVAFEKKLHLSAFMVPGETVSVPIGAAESLSWLLDPFLSLAWTGGAWLEQGTAKAAKAGTKYLFARGSPGRKAVWDCTEAVYKAAAAGASDVATWDTGKTLKTGLGLSFGAGKCATSWQAARQSAADLPPLAAIQNARGQAQILEADAGLVKQGAKAFKLTLCAVRRVFCKP